MGQQPSFETALARPLRMRAFYLSEHLSATKHKFAYTATSSPTPTTISAIPRSSRGEIGCLKE